MGFGRLIKSFKKKTTKGVNESLDSLKSLGSVSSAVNEGAITFGKDVAEASIRPAIDIKTLVKDSSKVIYFAAAEGVNQTFGKVFGFSHGQEHLTNENARAESFRSSVSLQDTVRLSRAAYGVDARSGRQIFEGASENDLGGFEEIQTREIKDLSYSLYKSKSDGHVVVSFRGTSNTITWLRNVNFKETDMGDGIKVHAGFYAAFKEVEGQLRQDLTQELGSSWNNFVSFTGHSLGGAMAQIATSVFSKEQRSEIIDCSTFGAPVVGNAEFNQSIRAGHLINVVDPEDPVPSMVQMFNPNFVQNDSAYRGIGKGGKLTRTVASVKKELIRSGVNVGIDLLLFSLIAASGGSAAPEAAAVEEGLETAAGKALVSDLEKGTVASLEKGAAEGTFASLEKGASEGIEKSIADSVGKGTFANMEGAAVAASYNSATMAEIDSLGISPDIVAMVDQLLMEISEYVDGLEAQEALETGVSSEAKEGIETGVSGEANVLTLAQMEGSSPFVEFMKFKRTLSEMTVSAADLVFKNGVADLTESVVNVMKKAGVRAIAIAVVKTAFVNIGKATGWEGTPEGLRKVFDNGFDYLYGGINNHPIESYQSNVENKFGATGENIREEAARTAEKSGEETVGSNSYFTKEELDAYNAEHPSPDPSPDPNQAPGDGTTPEPGPTPNPDVTPTETEVSSFGLSFSVTGGKTVNGEPLRAEFSSREDKNGNSLIEVFDENGTLKVYTGPQHPSSSTTLYGKWTGPAPYANGLPAKVFVRAAGRNRTSALDSFSLLYTIQVYEDGHHNDEIDKKYVERIQTALDIGTISSQIDQTEYVVANAIIEAFRLDGHIFNVKVREGMDDRQRITSLETVISEANKQPVEDVGYDRPVFTKRRRLNVMSEFSSAQGSAALSKVLESGQRMPKVNEVTELSASQESSQFTSQTLTVLERLGEKNSIEYQRILSGYLQGVRAYKSSLEVMNELRSVGQEYLSQPGRVEGGYLASAFTPATEGDTDRGPRRDNIMEEMRNDITLKILTSLT